MQAKSLEESETSENAWLQSAVCEFNNLCFAKHKIGLSVHVRECLSSKQYSVLPESGKRMCRTDYTVVTHAFYLVAYNESGVVR